LVPPQALPPCPTRRSSDLQAGNVVETLDYVPGTYLLPLVSRCLTMQGCDPAAALAAGGLVVSNATVEVAGTRGLPVPWAWFRRKDRKSTRLNSSHVKISYA